MLKKSITVFIIMICVACAKAQELVKFNLTITTDSISFISLTAKKVCSKSTAAAYKKQLQLAVIPVADAFGKRLEWYNLSGKDNKTPDALNGNNTGIAAISFDRDVFDKCNTTADLARMAGHITKNSLSHFAVIEQDGKLTQRCFIIEMENGKRGLIYIDKVNDNAITATIKIEPGGN